LPTKGYDSVDQLYDYKESGEIGLCSLAALVAGRIGEDEYEDVAYYALKMVDNVIELMDYPFVQLALTAKARRSVGIGITNMAYAMAKGGYSYTTEEGRNFVHRLAELHSFSLHKASLRLAKERGVCDWIDRTKYPDGWFPHDDAVEAIDTVHNQPLLQDWETLRKEIVAFGGIRHSVLEAHMPCESSSVASGTLNGVYPVRSLKTVKSSGNGRKNVVIVPEYDLLKDKYDIAWDVPTKNMIEIYGLLQKFTGQGISADFYLVFKDGEERKVSTKELITDYLYMMKMGVKTAYYLNTKSSVTGVNTGSRDQIVEEIVDDSCEACKL
jgi:ribonucleoside-diphosphate reductase alpha chain